MFRYSTLTGHEINLTPTSPGDQVAPSVCRDEGRLHQLRTPATRTSTSPTSSSATSPYRLTDSADREGNARISGANVVWTGDGTYSGYELGNIYAGRLVIPSISIAPPTVVPYGSKVTATGSMTENGIPFGGQPLGLAWSLDGIVFTNPGGATDRVRRVVLDRVGQAREDHEVQNHLQRQDLRPCRLGVRIITHFSAYSAVKTVAVQVYTSAPSAPSTVKHGRAFTSRGALKPQHTVGAKAGYIYCYRKESGSGSFARR